MGRQAVAAAVGLGDGRRETFLQGGRQHATADALFYVEAEVHTRADDPAGRVLALFDVFCEQPSDPAYRGCPFVNAAVDDGKGARQPVQDLPARPYGGRSSQ
ncbi:hypothetical protein [Planomonospora parontospora]|uniref:hypothetical protein n=1 Tax=Planomonospora parontospora TaxID=58119 RepID=UPI001670D280|nr:hypothetical protein [Planomonospora parontospora]GGL58748.1 hypothetical protein GCM10014719_70180 [Planomonospora parontospora subsp. antibiotica]GII20176.1 hypothetical protein Ppa05_69020 [Planomonospora parontospora subsp. antibiotica]